MFFSSKKTVLQNETYTLDFEEVRQKIRELAYLKWENAGCPEGKAEEFWVEAEHDLFGDNPLSDGGYQVRLDDGSQVVVKPE